MRIALFAFHFAEYAYRLATALAKEHEVLCFMNRDSALQELGEETLAKSVQNLRIVYFPKLGPKNPRFIGNVWRIARELARFRPQVIHYQESLNYAFTIARHLFPRVPLVLTVHDHVPHSGADARVSPSSRRHRAYLRKQADWVIVHGERIRAESETLFPWLRGRIAAIPHGPLGPVSGNAEQGWEKGALLFFGRIEEYKGLGFLIEAARLVHQQGVPVKVIIAGRGTDLEHYRGQIAADSMFELLEAFIPVSDVERLFRRANAVVLPYTDATQSGVVAMALQYGRPVIATDVGSVGEVIRDGYNGLLVPPRDPAKLADAIKKMVGDQAFAHRMAENALQLAKGELSWSTIATQTTRVYTQAMQG